MELHGLPNDILNNLDPLALIILIPIFDIFLYPFLRKVGINFSPLKRIATGFFTGSMAMVWACVVQAYMYVPQIFPLNFKMLIQELAIRSLPAATKLLRATPPRQLTSGLKLAHTCSSLSLKSLPVSPA